MDWVKIAEYGALGVLGSVIIAVVWMFLRHMREQARSSEAAFSRIQRDCGKCRRQFTRTIQNHVTHATEAAIRQTETLGRLEASVTKLTTSVDRIAANPEDRKRE